MIFINPKSIHPLLLYPLNFRRQIKMEKQLEIKSLDKLFKPNTIAVFGASNKEGSVGNSIMKNLLHGAYTGEIYPINLRAQEILNLKAYQSVTEISATIDLAVIATPGHAVYGILEDCGKAGINAAVIISAGFKEVGKEGQRLFADLKSLATKLGIRIIGPNCVGIVNTHLGINASFLSRNAIPGKIAMISQSGAICASILDWAYDQSVGFSYFVSIGSMMDIDFGDLVEYFGQDPGTSCILIYMESLINADKFLHAAQRYTKQKPIIILKAGKSDAGAKAALSHTGALTGNDAVYNSAFRRAGIIRVNSMEQLFDCAQGLAMQPLPQGKRLTIVTNAGGPGVLATDSLIQHGGELAKLSTSTLAALNQLLPTYWSHNNPVDVLGSATVSEFQKAVEICLQDDNTDAILAIFTTQGITDPNAAAKVIASLSRPGSKPIFACWLGEQDVEPGRELLEQAAIPNFRYPENAVDVFLKMALYEENLSFLNGDEETVVPDFTPDRKTAQKIISNVRAASRRQLLEPEAKELLRCYQIPTASGALTKSAQEAGALALEIGFPVAMKIVSPDIGHKTEVDGVILDIKNEAAVQEEYNGMIERVKRLRPDAMIEGILIEEMVNKKFELLIGARHDPVFGPVVVFGLGGIMVELIRDTNMELIPLNHSLAMRLMKNTKAYKLISGFRGLPVVDVNYLAEVLVNFSLLLLDFPQISEIDMNPFVADERGALALDAYIVLKNKDSLWQASL